MKNKIKIILILVVALGTMSSIQSCNKYEDGPIFSVRSRAARVANTWKVDNYKVNDTDYTSLVAGYTETFSKDGNYSYTWSALAGTGSWDFQNNDMEIKITGITNQSDQVLHILKLEEKQFWYYIMDGSDKKEYHMVQK